MKRIAFDRVRILLASSDAVLRERTRTILEAFGTRDVMEAADGFEALDLFGASQLDLVLADSVMPLIDGLELTRLIRLTECTGGEGGNPYAPVIVMGSVPGRDGLRRAFDAGVTEYLRHNAIAPAPLFQLIESVIRDPRPFIHNADYFGPDRRRLGREATSATPPLVAIEETGIGPVTREAFPDHSVLHVPNVLAARALVDDDAPETSRDAAIARAEAALLELSDRYAARLVAEAGMVEAAFRVLEAGPALASARDGVLDAAVRAQRTALRHGFANAALIAGELCSLLEDVRIEAGALQAVSCHIAALRSAAAAPSDDAMVGAMVEQLAILGSQMRRRAATFESGEVAAWAGDAAAPAARAER